MLLSGCPPVLTDGVRIAPRLVTNHTDLPHDLTHHTLTQPLTQIYSMTQSHTEEASPGVTSIVDHESLRNNSYIPFHEDHDVVDESVVEQVAELGDLAAV